jgi:hemerythrin-like metal-binding protein
MPFLNWNDTLGVGVKALDEDHKRMAALIDELHEGILSAQSNEILEDILSRLIDCTRSHFAREEKLLAEADYPNVSVHKAQHDALAEWAIQTEIDFYRGTLTAPLLDVVNQMKDWFLAHMNGPDHLYGAHLNAMGIY